MIYDEDLAGARRAVFGLLLFSFLIEAIYIYNKLWWGVLPALPPLIYCFIWLKIIRCQQHTRDINRIVSAALNSSLETFEP